MTFKIEDGIPIAGAAGAGGSNKKYPFKEMKVGQSFFVDVENAQKVQGAAHQFAKKHPEYKFLTRREGEGRRVWRVA